MPEDWDFHSKPLSLSKLGFCPSLSLGLDL